MSEDTFLIHVRFAPNGSVTEIGERPVELSAQEWFNLLSQKAGSTYQPLSGGRAVFRVTRDQVAALQPASA